LKIYVAGHKGMVGSAIVRQLLAQGHPAQRVITRTHAQLDLTNQAATNHFFATEKPDQVYLAAARVGGIHANNTYPAEFIYSNLMVEANVIHAAFTNGVTKLLFLGSSCIYPRPGIPAHARGRPTYRYARAHQRALCHCQNSGH
jgi:GDP-L-fucose synthase